MHWIRPDGWTNFIVSQNGILLPVKLVNENSKTYLVVDVIPNKGNINIRNTKVITDIVVNYPVSSFTVYPNPFHTMTNIQLVLERAAQISLDLLDESGKKIRTITTGPYNAGSHEIRIDASGLTGNVFYCLLYVDGQAYIRKIISRE
jgi:hypothetical protein